MFKTKEWEKTHSFVYENAFSMEKAVLWQWEVSEMSKGGNTVTLVENLCTPLAEEQGVYIWEISYQKEGGDWVLKVLIDTEEGITIDQCERFNRSLSEKLDKTDPIAEAYILEVSSPGIERELTEDWHFEKLLGEGLQVNLIRPVDGEKFFVGELLGKDGDIITLRLENGKELGFTKKDAAWIRKYVAF